MRMIALPLVALLLLPACKASVTSQAQQQQQQQQPASTLADYNQQALADERRVLDLEGGRNFRDLGGYRTEDGRQVKWRTVYRSGTPGNLTEKDFKTLNALGIRSVCDFRSNEERKTEPNRYVAANSNVDYWTRDYNQGGGDLRAVLGGPDASAEKSRARMMDIYRTLPEEHAESYREMFRRLAAGEIPLAFNCSAGKDRAGVGAALILTLLGVPREAVVADYALSDDIIDYRREIEAQASKKSSYSALAGLPWETLQPLLASDPAYITTALDTLARKYGSVSAFIEQELRVTPEMKAQIRSNLLEPVETT